MSSGILAQYANVLFKSGGADLHMAMFPYSREICFSKSSLFSCPLRSNFKAVAPSAEFIRCLGDDKEISSLHHLI